MIAVRARLAIICIAATALLALLLPMHVSAETEADYDRFLSSISRGLSSALALEHKSPGSGKQAIEQLAGTVPKSVKVTTSTGRTYTTSLDWLKTELHDISDVPAKKRADRLVVLVERIDTLKAASSRSPGLAARQTREARRVLGYVLSGSEYKPSAQEQFQQRLLRALSNAMRWLSIPDSVAVVIGWVLLGLVVIVFAYCLVRIALALLNYVPRGRKERSEPERLASATPPPSVTSTLEAAEREAAAGRYREAFRAVYLASILILDRAKLVKYTKGVTNWEYLRALKRQQSGQTAEIFEQMTRSFDDMIYGKQSVSRSDYAKSIEDYRLLEGALT